MISFKTFITEARKGSGFTYSNKRSRYVSSIEISDEDLYAGKLTPPMIRIVHQVLGKPPLTHNHTLTDESGKLILSKMWKNIDSSEKKQKEIYLMVQLLDRMKIRYSYWTAND